VVTAKTYTVYKSAETGNRKENEWRKRYVLRRFLKTASTRADDVTSRGRLSSVQRRLVPFSHRKRLIDDSGNWKGVYVGSLDATMTTTGDGDDWNRRRTRWM